MRLIIMLVIAAVGFHYVNKNLNESGQTPIIASTGNGAISDLWDGADTILHDATAEASDLYQRATGKPLVSGDQSGWFTRDPQCGEADRHGNINYCFRSAKEGAHR